jgi:hypothetical protein
MVGQEAKELLMEILEPLLGSDVDYPVFLMAINDYQMSHRYRNGEIGQRENIRRFLEVVKRGRIQKNSKIIFEVPREQRLKQRQMAQRSGM